MNIAQVLLVVLLVGYVIVRRFAGTPLTAPSLVLPLGLTAWGAYQLRTDHLTGIDVAILAVEVLAGLAAGVARGLTIKIFVREGVLWQRYGLATLGVWIATIALRIAFAIGGHALGATLASGSTIMLMLGASLVTEALVVGQRARTTGIPFAPGRRRGADDMVAPVDVRVHR